MTPDELDALFLRRLAEIDVTRREDTKLLPRVDRSGECWLWKGCRNPKTNYGVVGYRGEYVYTHRLALLLTSGIPDGWYACHACDENYPVGDRVHRACCRPSHLFAGTAADNSRDAAEKNRIAFGSKSHFAKLTESDVEQIADRIRAGERFRKIARDFDVSYQAIVDIRHGAAWQRVTGDLKQLPKIKVRGSCCMNAKLSEEQVADIRARRDERGIDLAREYGVSQASISRIRSGEHWAHVAPANDNARATEATR